MSPSKQERKFRPQYALTLIRIARGDLLSAKVLATATQGRKENAFFLAQQSIEKLIKAVLVKRGIAVPLVHELGALLAKLPAEAEPPYGYELNELNQYASTRRYEEGEFEPSSEELQILLDKAQKMLEWAEVEVTK